MRAGGVGAERFCSAPCFAVKRNNQPTAWPMTAAPQRCGIGHKTPAGAASASQSARLPKAIPPPNRGPRKVINFVGRGGARERSQFPPAAETERSGLCDDEGP